MSGSDIFVMFLCIIVVIVMIFCVIADHRCEEENENKEGDEEL